jgi:type I restriction enzyme S subunit
MVRLGDLFEFKNGRSFSTTEWKEVGLPIIRIQNLNDISSGFNYFDGDYDKSIEVNKNDLLFSWSGTVGSSFGPHIWGRDKGVLNQHIYKVSFKTDMISKYAYYALLFLTEEIERSVVGAVGLVHVTKKSLNEFKIYVPAVPEQKRIVTILDQAFADIEQARAKTEQNLKNVRELFESYLQQVFSEGDEGWGFYQLSELCELISGQHIDAKDYNFDRKGIGYLTGPSDFGQLNPIVTKWTEHPKRTAVSGDILITVKGSGVGKINIMSESELAISRQLMAVRPTGANGEILYWFLSMQFNYFQSLANGAAIPGISRSDVLDLKLSIPSADAQPLLASAIRQLKVKVAELEKIYQKKLTALDELKKSILQKAFTGQLTNKKSQKVAA